MRLAVLDTNVIVSAGIHGGGVPGLIVDSWVLEGLVQLVVCPRILRQYRAVMGREKFRRHGFPPEWLEVVIEESLQLADPPAWPHPMPDAKDAAFLGLAKMSGAWLVSGNLKHFPRAARNGVTVLSPADYLSHLRESESGL